METAEIELGVTAEQGGLRYWRAKEAVRQGELGLAAQASTRQAFEARATALLGWVVAVGAALAAWLSANTTPPFQQKLPALVIFAVLFATAAACIPIIWPQFWGQPGYNPRFVLDSTLDTELEQLEQMAIGYADAINVNERYMNRAGWLMRLAFCLIASIPFIGAVVLFLVAAA
jgi:hypothetical protein